MWPAQPPTLVSKIYENHPDWRITNICWNYSKCQMIFFFFGNEDSGNASSLSSFCFMDLVTVFFRLHCLNRREKNMQYVFILWKRSIGGAGGDGVCRGWNCLLLNSLYINIISRKNSKSTSVQIFVFFLYERDARKLL